MRYLIDEAASKLIVRARSSLHDTTTTWSRLRGEATATASALAAGGATLALTVDMTAFDAGDFLKNRKVRKDLELERHPEASFALARLEDVRDRGDGRFEAVAVGAIRWRGREVPVSARGEGRLDDARLEARAEFELDVTAFGVAAPRFLMFKVEDVVAVAVVLVGRPG